MAGRGAGDKAGEKLRLILKVANENGILVARILSPDQGDREHVAQSIRMKDRSVEFYLVFISAAYDGIMNDDGDEIDGTWKQHEIEAPLVFRRVVTQ